MMRYRLSGRQLKELRNRKRLQIALPHPGWDRPPDQIAAALLALPDDARVVSATERDLKVDPSPGRGGGLTAILGTIVRDGDPEPLWWIWMDAVVVALEASYGRPRGVYPVQWPGSVELRNGWVYPHPSGTQPTD